MKKKLPELCFEYETCNRSKDHIHPGLYTVDSPNDILVDVKQTGRTTSKEVIIKHLEQVSGPDTVSGGDIEKTEFTRKNGILTYRFKLENSSLA